jgi:putative transcriptional regulator
MNEENRDIWQEVLDGVREIKSGGGKRFTVEIPPVVDARHQVGFSQVKFAELLGVSEQTLQDWEQGRCEPTGAAHSLLILAKKRPEVLREVFG